MLTSVLSALCSSALVFDPTVLRAEGIAKTAAYSASPLEGWTHSDRPIIEDVCSHASPEGGSAHNPTERWMCESRGKGLSESLSGHMGFSRAGIEKVVTKATERSGEAYLVWVRIQNGAIVNYRTVGHHRDDTTPGVEVVLHHLAFAALAHRSGVFASQHTFEYLAGVSYGCRGTPFTEAHMTLYPPILSPSKGNDCPHNLPFPTVPSIFEAIPQQREWDSLKDTAIFRGGLDTDARGWMVVASREKYITDLDAKVTCHGEMDGAECNGLLNRLSYARQIPKAIDKHSLCRSPALCYTPTDGIPDEISGHKYIISMESVGESWGRAQKYAAFPGCVVEVVPAFETYFDSDLISFVHVVKIDNAMSSTNVALHWLRENQADAKQMATESSRFAESHLQLHAELRYFQLLSALYSHRWNDTASHNPFPKMPPSPAFSVDAQERSRRELGGPVDCSNIAHHYNRYLHIFPPDYEKLNQTCGMDVDEMPVMREKEKKKKKQGAVEKSEEAGGGGGCGTPGERTLRRGLRVVFLLVVAAAGAGVGKHGAVPTVAVLVLSLCAERFAGSAWA